MSWIKNYQIFFGSLLCGIFLWCFIYAIFPLKAVEPLKIETVFYVVFGYFAMILGFITFNFKTKESSKSNIEVTKTITVLLTIIVISFIIRWIDLFYIRELSFDMAPKRNRVINSDNYNNSNLLFLLASIIKSIYFFPFVLVVSSKLKQKSSIVYASYIVLLFPFVEALLRGTRKPFFEVFVIILFALIIFQRNKINIKKITIIVFSFLFLMTVSMMILMQRENKLPKQKDLFYTKLLESRYNEILAPDDNVIAFFENTNTPNTIKFYAMTALHTGQYITHGLFEFNHIVGYKDLPITYGKYTFMTIPKFINKTGLFNPVEITNPSPRQHVYLSFFGDLYIDFRWGLIPFMFLFGIAQKYTFQKARYNSIYNPIVIYFLIINVFLLTINYINGAGVYPFVGFCLAMLIVKFLQRIINEKSIST